MSKPASSITPADRMAPEEFFGPSLAGRGVRVKASVTDVAAPSSLMHSGGNAFAFEGFGSGGEFQVRRPFPPGRRALTWIVSPPGIAAYEEAQTLLPTRESSERKRVSQGVNWRYAVLPHGSSFSLKDINRPPRQFLGIPNPVRARGKTKSHSC
jgi:hypothetical protein